MARLLTTFLPPNVTRSCGRLHERATKRTNANQAHGGRDTECGALPDGTARHGGGLPGEPAPRIGEGFSGDVLRYRVARASQDVGGCMMGVFVEIKPPSCRLVAR